MIAKFWNRDMCMEEECTCHDDEIEPYACSGCGCSFYFAEPFVKDPVDEYRMTARQDIAYWSFVAKEVEQFNQAAKGGTRNNG
jgi:hypothetical protein